MDPNSETMVQLENTTWVAGTGELTFWPEQLEQLALGERVACAAQDHPHGQRLLHTEDTGTPELMSAQLPFQHFKYKSFA
jgi:hypothetical protein